MICYLLNLNYYLEIRTRVVGNEGFPLDQDVVVTVPNFQRKHDPPKSLPSHSMAPFNNHGVLKNMNYMRI